MLIILWISDVIQTCTNRQRRTETQRYRRSSNRWRQLYRQHIRNSIDDFATWGITCIVYNVSYIWDSIYDDDGVAAAAAATDRRNVMDHSWIRFASTVNGIGESLHIVLYSYVCVCACVRVCVPVCARARVWTESALDIWLQLIYFINILGWNY